MVIWKERIINLLDVSGINRSEFAQGIHKSQSAINQMLDPDKNKSLNSNTLIEICQYFNVSSDYILGLSDDSSNDYKNVEMGKKIGFNALATKSILSAMEKEEIRDTMNEIFSTFPANCSLLENIVNYFNYYPESLDQITIYRTNDLLNEKDVVLEQTKGEILEKVYLQQIEDILVQTKRGSTTWHKKKVKEEKYLDDIRNRLIDCDYEMSQEERNALEAKLLLADLDFKNK